MKGIAVITVLAAVTTAQTPVPKLFVNGKAAKNVALKSKGKVYVAVEDLKTAGAEVTVTGDKVSIQFKPLKEKLQVDASEGILGEFVQNERFRVKVHSFEPCPNPFGVGPGYKVKLEIRNLAKTAQVFGTSGLPELQLVDKAGHVLAISAGSLKDQYTSLAPGNGFTNDVTFGDRANKLTELDQPDKLLILFRPSGGVKLKDIRIFFPAGN